VCRSTRYPAADSPDSAASIGGASAITITAAVINTAIVDARRKTMLANTTTAARPAATNAAPSA
jgi:hypothetical protein